MSTKNWSNETHVHWNISPPWKHRHDLFNDKPYNNSVEYFRINEDDHITNQSYIEISKLTVCNEVNITFYSKMSSFHNSINLVLFIYKHNVWNKEWEYRNNNSQWQFHQLKIQLTDQNEDIKLRFIPISKSSYQNSITIAMVNITTHTNCQINKSPLKNPSSLYSFLFVILGSAVLLIFITVMVIFVYGIINKRWNYWLSKRSNRGRRKGRRNVIRDESTVIGAHIDAV